MESDFQPDSLYVNPIEQPSSFKFDDAVARVFPDMIQRSVPGYGAIISAIGLLGKKYAQPDSNCYDLGCSLGAVALSLSQNITASRCRIVAVDSSSEMIDRSRQIIGMDRSTVPVELMCADIREIDIKRASIVVLNFTLQFIPIVDRLKFLSKIYSGLLPGGVLIVSEKLQLADTQQQSLFSEMHHAFKSAQGYSDLEISQKRTALENVLIPETLPVHEERLKRAGFTSCGVWFQYFNFASMIALK
ncbi:MAG: carboxy-S-adenosyl-L-methionine synthase CmoA [Methylococcales bacterium]